MIARVSVVIPCYNAERYLAEAVDSVLAQDVAGVEILIVDDGSTDGSAGIAERCANQSAAPIRIERQSNQGISASRNRGIAMATASVIAFLDADDLMPAGSLQSRLSVLDQHADVDVASGMVVQFVSSDVDDATRQTLNIPVEPSRGRVAGAMLVRREVFDCIGLFDSHFQLGETIDWVARADAAGIVTHHLDDVVLRRRVHSANSVRKAAQLRADYLRVLRASIARQRGATQ
ncbi:MAG: glycosyltransferase family A protein [Gemmatimonas sp.]